VQDGVNFSEDLERNSYLTYPLQTSLYIFYLRTGNFFFFYIFFFFTCWFSSHYLFRVCECLSERESDSDMAEVPPPQPVEIDPEFEPLSRPRSCTWPLPRPELSDPASSNTSSPAPSVQQEPGGNTEFISNLGLLEEDYEEYAEQKPHMPCNDFRCRERNCVHPHHHHHPPPPPPPHPQQQLPGPQLPPQQQVPPPGVAPLGSSGQRKSSSSRRNAWGNMSYADLITKAIDSSPEKRLTLSQIYDWMVKNVPYFKDKGDSNSSAGWKVSVLKHHVEMGWTWDGLMVEIWPLTPLTPIQQSKHQQDVIQCFWQQQHIVQTLIWTCRNQQANLNTGHKQAPSYSVTYCCIIGDIGRHF